MDRLQKIALLEYDKKILEEKFSHFSIDTNETEFSITKKSEIAILIEGIREIDEMIHKRLHQTDQVYNSEIMYRFLKIINNDGQSNNEVEELWMSLY